VPRVHLPRALAPDGLMVQWVSPENAFAHELLVRTFLQAFPHATLWLAGDLLVGSPSPLRLDLTRLEERLADPAAAASLAEVGFLKPQDVLAHFRADTEELGAYAGPGPILTDDRPLLEYFRSLDVPREPADVGRFSSDVRKVLAN
jgi:spermidine synthase